MGSARLVGLGHNARAARCRSTGSSITRRGRVGADFARRGTADGSGRVLDPVRTSGVWRWGWRRRGERTRRIEPRRSLLRVRRVEVRAVQLGEELLAPRCSTVRLIGVRLEPAARVVASIAVMQRYSARPCRHHSAMGCVEGGA